MHRYLCLGIGLLAGLMTRHTSAASSWDMESNRMPRAASQGNIEASNSGKDNKLDQRVTPTKLESQTGARHDGVGTFPSHAVTSVVSSLGGSASEGGLVKNEAVVTDAQTFKVCVSEELLGSVEAGAGGADARATPVNRSSSGNIAPKHSDISGASKPKPVSLNADLKRFLSAGNVKLARANAMEKRFVSSERTFGTQVLTR